MKLWIVERTLVSMALAETEQEAIDATDEALRWEEPDVDVYAWTVDMSLPVWWNDTCNVYHLGDEDITVAEAKRRVMEKHVNE